MFQIKMTTDAPPAVFKPWNNPSNLIDHYTSWIIETIINVGFFPIIVFVGVINNILNMIIYSKQASRKNILKKSRRVHF
jgi:hypothetical protein